jgi:hypothetical protein
MNYALTSVSHGSEIKYYLNTHNGSSYKVLFEYVEIIKLYNLNCNMF